MKKFYSIVKIVSNITISDSISVGLIVNDGNRLWYKFSDYKKNIAKKLYSSNSKDIDFIIKQLEHRLNEINLNWNTSTDNLFDFPIKNSISSSDYFSYLGIYNSGILQFNPPKPIVDSHNIDLDKYFKLYVDESNHFKENKGDKDFRAIRKKVEKNLIHRVQEKIHTNIRIDGNLVPEVFFPIDLDCIGKNGALVGAKSLSFEHSAQTVDKNISHYIALIAFLSRRYSENLKDNRFYLIANEPKSIKSDVYRIWDKVYKNELIDILNPEESNIVAEHVEDTNAGTFL